MRSFFDDFKKFLMRGNVLDLAVAVIIGVAFNMVVQSMVNNILMPIVGAIFGKPSFADLTLDIGDGVVRYGQFITDLINFVIVAFSVFVVVKAFEAMQNLRRRGEISEDDESLSDEAVLLAEIRDLIRAQGGR
jgi:large conductance mechanosensitive channel